jgi:signal peptidase II
LRYVFGPWTWLGALVAVASMAIDQASKLWLLFVFDIGAREPVHVLPFLDLVLVWNTGISYGLFHQEGLLGQWLLIGFKAVAVVVMWIWLARADSRLIAIALGLIIGGAAGNAIDRLAYGAVFDFALFHIDRIQFEWYVFNLADVAIVAGVALVLYDSLLLSNAVKAP